MNIVTDLSIWYEYRKNLHNKNVGFVPTMGNLHEGHLALCRRAQAENEVVVVSIFINPMQFNQSQDFDRYPRTLEQDQALLESLSVDVLFLPTASLIYPDQYEIQVAENKISSRLEGEFRPGHFTGMLTVILKLLNLIRPTRAYFGEKDYQQFLLVEKMARALFLPVEIIPCQTVRTVDGLALSSRNSRLNAAQHEQAVRFAQMLQNGASPSEIKESLQYAGFKVEYVADAWGRRLAAVWLDDVRLIDNIVIT